MKRCSKHTSYHYVYIFAICQDICVYVRVFYFYARKMEIEHARKLKNDKKTKKNLKKSKVHDEL